MNNITYAVSVDVNNPIIPYNVYVANVLDSSVRYLEITLYQNGNVITLSNTATATASLVTDNVLVDDSVECTISNNIITVPLEDLQRHGNLDVQVTVTEGEKVLAIPFPIQVRVTPNIAENAQIDENSLGSYAEVVQEIAEARKGYDSLDERLNSDASGMEAVMNKVQSIGSMSQTFDNVHYPSVTAVRDYVNIKTDDLEDFIEGELNELDEAKADKADTAAQFERLIAVLQRKADSAETLAGYGINDAYTKAEVDALDEAKADKAEIEAMIDSLVDPTLLVQGKAADAKVTGEIRTKQNILFNGLNVSFTESIKTPIYLESGESVRITVTDKTVGNIFAYIDGHSSASITISKDGVYIFTASFDGYLGLYTPLNPAPTANMSIEYISALSEKLSDVESETAEIGAMIDALKDTVSPSVNGDVEQGSYHTAGGWGYDTDIACRTASYTPQAALRAVFNDGIKGSVRAFDINGNYVGGYTGSGFSTDYTQFAKLDSPIALRDLTAEYDYNLQLVFTKSAGGNIVPNDVGLQYEVSAIPDEPEIYTVGTNGDFSSFTEMLIALASNSKEKIVYVYGGVYDIFDEMGGAEYISSIENASSLGYRRVNHIVPPNTTIIGVGKVVLEWNPSDSEIIDQAHAFLFSPLNLSGSCTIKNIEIRCSNCRYGIHDETGGTAVYNGTERVLDNVRVYFTASTYGTHYAYGAGHNKNSKYIYNNCVFSAAYGIAWSSHDWPATEYENSTFEFNNCIFKNNLPTSPSGKAGIRFSSSAKDSRQDIVKINGCDFNNITFATEGSSSIKQGYTVTTMLCPSFTVTYSSHIASEDRIAPTVYLSVSGDHGGQDYVLTNQDKSDIADIVLGELPTTQGVLYGN